MKAYKNNTWCKAFFSCIKMKKQMPVGDKRKGNTEIY